MAQSRGPGCVDRGRASVGLEPSEYIRFAAVSSVNVHSNVHTAGTNWPSDRTNGVVTAYLYSRRAPTGLHPHIKGLGRLELPTSRSSDMSRALVGARERWKWGYLAGSALVGDR